MQDSASNGLNADCESASHSVLHKLFPQHCPAHLRTFPTWQKQEGYEIWSAADERPAQTSVDHQTLLINHPPPAGGCQTEWRGFLTQMKRKPCPLLKILVHFNSGVAWYACHIPVTPPPGD